MVVACAVSKPPLSSENEYVSITGIIGMGVESGNLLHFKIIIIIDKTKSFCEVLVGPKQIVCN